MAENARCMVLAYDMDGKLLFANPTLDGFTGYSASDLQEADFGGRVHPDDRQRMTERRERLFREGAYLDEEYRRVAKNGRVKWVSATWRPVVDEGGRQIGVQGSEHDITARKYAEQALQESERRFRELLDSLQLAAVMVNLKGYVSYCNDYALNLAGCTRDEVIGHPADQFLDAESRRQLTAAIDPARTGCRPRVPYKGAILTRNGERRWLQWTCLALRDVDGQIVGFASVGADMLSRGDHRESVVGRVAHDFNNLLAVIHACSDLISDRLPEGDPAREAVEEIRGAGRRGFQLTQQLFALSPKLEDFC